MNRKILTWKRIDGTLDAGVTVLGFGRGEHAPSGAVMLARLTATSCGDVHVTVSEFTDDDDCIDMSWKGPFHLVEEKVVDSLVSSVRDSEVHHVLRDVLALLRTMPSAYTLNPKENSDEIL